MLTLVRIFLFALAIRWAYVAVLYLGFGTEGLLGPDSHGYLTLANAFAEAASSGEAAGWQLLGPDPSLMPIFVWLLTLHVALAGEHGALAYVLTQGVFDASTCVVVTLIARQFIPNGARFSGYAAALSPTLIVLSGLVYTDTIFVFFATLALYGTLCWASQPTWRAALLLGAALGLAFLTRALIAPFVLPLLLALAVIVWIRGRLRLTNMTQLAVAGLIVAISIAPIMARNVSVFGAWALTPQGGAHLAYWVLPLVQERIDGTPREKTNAATRARMQERFGARASGNPFTDSQHLNTYAAEELRKLGWAAVARAWTVGAAVNLASPALVHVPPVSALPRTGFYDTPGTNILEKTKNFIFGSGNNQLYSRLFVIGLAGVFVFRLLQLAGIAALLRQRADAGGLLILLGWCVYVLAVNGPVASPKYRLPLEPVLAVLTGAALTWRRNAGPSLSIRTTG